MASGYVVYDGASELNGEPIVCVLTGFDKPSKNPKTGPMIQAWLLHRETPPTVASVNGDDAAVCGSCPLRTVVRENGTQDRICYVKPFQGPRSVWAAYKRGKYPPAANLVEAVRLVLRHGAYGEPTAMPYALFTKLTRQFRGWTGYTHTWRTCNQRFRKWLMASCETLEDKLAANAKGWRTFRVIADLSQLQRDEIICPATEEGGKRTTCAKCRLCNGFRPGVKNIAVLAHGAGKKSFVQQYT